VENPTTALPASEVSAAPASWEPDMLRTLPHPPDQPRSLFLTAEPPNKGLAPSDLNRPYFTLDPILDRRDWPEPGWFTNFQLDLIKPHVNNEMNQVMMVGGKQATIALGNAPLNWTVAPRFELGYRLPSGFGEFMLSDRFFNSSGNDIVNIKGIGPVARSISLNVNYADIDYGSREYTPSALWDMHWRVGARILETFTSTRAEDPFAAAAATNGIFEARQSNNTNGAGPHFTVNVGRKLGDSGFSMIGRADFAYTFGRQSQDFLAGSTTLNAAGHPEFAVRKGRLWDQIPVLNIQAGLNWRPPSHPNIYGFLGFVSETFWYVQNNSNVVSSFNTRTSQVTGNRGNFQDAGIVFRFGINY
jgi:hypothetical protein